jgi:hypothetical protein
MSLHNTQKLDDDLGRRANQDLSLATPFSIDDVVLSFVGLSNISGRSEPETDEQGSRSVY